MDGMTRAAAWRLPRFGRFLLVGLINTAAGIGTAVLLQRAAGLSYWPSTSTGLCAGLVVSFLLNRSYTFGSRVPARRAAVRFAAVAFACYLASYGAGRWIGTAVAAVPAAWIRADDAATFAGAGLYALLNYWGQRRYVFEGP